MIIVLDTETTGDGPQDQVIELALLSIPGRSARVKRFRPTVPITPEARGVHHLTDRELEMEPPAAAWNINAVIPYDVVIAAHFLEFDYRLLRQTWPGFARPYGICTYRCARHLWPDLPPGGYRLQSLRYRLGLDVSPAGNPHSAMYDAQVCLALLLRMLELRGVEDLLRMTFLPVLLPSYPMGEYRGQPFNDVPLNYLQWARDNIKDADPDLRHTIRHHLEDPDRPPVLLPEFRFGPHKYKPLPEVRTDFLKWLLPRDFDRDVIHTAQHHLNLREGKC